MAKITAETARNWKFETKQLHIGQEDYDPVTDSRAVPIYQTTSFVFRNSKHAADRFGLRDAGNIYGRLTNPTEDIFERRIAALEGGIAALSVASGAAAITYAIQNVALSGDHIVAARNIYGGTYNLLAHTLIDYNIETTFVDPLDPSNFEKAIKDNTKALYIETLGNPNSDIPDIDDMIASGESMLDVAKELKNRKARRVYCLATFGLFTAGLEIFDKAKQDGVIEKVITTNVTYQKPELFDREWYESADMSKYIAYLIDHINHDASISDLLDQSERIQARISEYKVKHTISDNYEG